MDLLAVGDISFFGRYADNPTLQVFSSLESILKRADLVIANLESPLVNGGCAREGKCTLRGNTGWASILKEMNIKMVSLANNHIMDFGEEGLKSTINSLNEAGIYYAGAGKNQEEAFAPRIISLKSRRLAFIGRSSVIVSSPCYASRDVPGAALLDRNEIIRTIKHTKKSSDFVVVMVHWGIEEYVYPSPDQVELSNDMINAGADLILGHHPHAVQGLSKRGNHAIAYSMGNFLFDDILWLQEREGATNKIIPVILSDENRKGIMLNILLDRTGNNLQVSELFTRIEPDGTIGLDLSPTRKTAFDKISRTLDIRFYKQWWQAYALSREWNLRIKPRLHINTILHRFWKIRPRHVMDFMRILKKSGNIASGRTTNPYE